MSNITPKYGSITQAIQTYSIGRSSLYLLAAQHPALFRKLGAKTLVSFAVLENIIADLPEGPSPKIRIKRGGGNA